MHENEPQQFPASQTESDLSATSGTPPDWPQTESETADVSQTDFSPESDTPQTDSEADVAAQKQTRSDTPVRASHRVTVTRRNPDVIPIGLTRTVQTDADKDRSDLLDLLESQRGKRILAGIIQGVEGGPGTEEVSRAVIYHGDYKVAIPAEMAVSPPEDSRGRVASDVMHQMLTRRLGAEVDYIVKAVDPKYHVAVGSRLEAMMAKRSLYYTRNRDGNRRVRAGACAEARVVSVIRPGIFVDIFGVETFVPLAELSYQRMMDATTAFQPGQRVLVRILRIQGQRPSEITVEASVKQAGDNPYEKAVRKYSVGNRYVGTVSMVNTTGVFVALDGGIDCLCNYPRRGRPPRGARATVKILGISQDTNRIWGVITHIALPQ